LLIKIKKEIKIKIKKETGKKFLSFACFLLLSEAVSKVEKLRHSGESRPPPLLIVNLYTTKIRRILYLCTNFY
jgi:hypothetical protein